MKHVLIEVTRARIVRFQPVDYRLHKALRVEVYGTKTPAGASVFDFELFGCSNEHTMIKDQTYQMFYNINYSDLCLLISKNQSMTTFLLKRN